MSVEATPTASIPKNLPSTVARARRLVKAGMVAGPLLVVTWVAQAVTRDGYDVTRHPMSLLALGEGGVVQTANFIVAGFLVIALGRGLGLLFTTGTGRKWLPRLVQLTGIGLIAAGVFPVDPGAGFPRGAPEGMPEYTTIGILHEIGFAIVMIAWTATLFILMRRFHKERRKSLRNVTIATLLTVLVLSVWPHAESFPIRTVIASGIQLAFLAVIAYRHLPRN